jgi:hypothetical protein
MFPRPGSAVPRKKREPLEEFVQFRFTARDHARLRRVAESEHLTMGTWARQAVLRALDQREQRVRAVAEPRGSEE